MSLALREASRAIRKASFDLPQSHPDQDALHRAHAVLFTPSPTAAAPTGVDISHGESAARPGRES